MSDVTRTFSPRLSPEQDQLYGAVAARVSELQRKATDETRRYPDVAGRLARLRRAITAQPGGVPEVWADTIGAIPEQLWGRSEGPSEWERAAHTAITLFALHVQGSSTAVHRAGISFGSAVRRLARARSGGDDLDAAVFRRFQQVATAATVDELNYHLRSMITLLRDERTQLDYGQLAVDIHDLALPWSANRVRLRWGRDYHRVSAEPDGTDQTTRDE